MSPKQRPAKKPFPIFWVAVGVVAAIVVTIAIVSASGDNKKSSSPGGTGNGATSHEYGKVVVTGAALPKFPDSGTDPAVGTKISTVKGENFAGQPVTIAANGKPQMIVFLAHWCPHCNREAPRLASYLKQNGGLPAGVDLTIVPTGSQDTAPNWPPSQWVKDMKIGDLTTLVDDKAQTAGAAFGLTSYPYIVMTDKDGKVVERRAGEQQDGFFAAAFTALADGTKIPQNA
jgi:Redoxin.